MYVISSSNGTSWSAIGWVTTKKYIIPNDGYYTFVLSDAVETSTVDLKQFVSNVSIETQGVSILNQYIDFISPNTDYIPSFYEYGNIRVSNDKLIYEEDSKRIRLNSNFLLKMSKGDIVSFKSPVARIYVLYSADNSTWSTNGWITSKYVIPDDGYYTFVLSDSVETSTPDFQIFISSIMFDIPSYPILNQYIDLMATNINTLPKYVKRFDYDDSITTFANSIKNGIDGNCLIFLQVTDSHVDISGYQTYMNLSRTKDHSQKVIDIANAVNADFVIHTGDLIQGEGSGTSDSREHYLAYLYNLSLLSTAFMFCQGNPWHDFGLPTNDASEPYELSRESVLTMAARFNKWVRPTYNSQGTLSSYYYFENDLRKVRCIVLDSDDYGTLRQEAGFSSEQITWLTNCLSEAREKNYSVIVFSHMAPLQSIGGVESNGGSDVHAALVNHIAQGGIIIEYVYGHIHADLQKTIDGVNYISLTCDLPSVATNIPTDAVAPSRTLDTITEYAIDVHVVNCDAHTDHIYRYGAGSNRTIS